MDWELLSHDLSPAVLAALQEHLREKSNVSDPIDPIDSVAGDDSDQIVTDVKTKKDPKHKNHVYKDKGYWDERFMAEDEYDWLLKFEQTKDYLFPVMLTSFPERNCKILIVGCGNSSFSGDLYDNGFENIVNIDFSPVVIEKMQSSNSKRNKMTWICADMTTLAPFETNSFDVVIDKASMDALMVDEGDVWDPNADVVFQTDSMCNNISRVLTSSGIFIQISFAQPHFRTKYLMAARIGGDEIHPYESMSGHCSRYGWELTFSTIEVEGGCLSTFLYVMKKVTNHL